MSALKLAVKEETWALKRPFVISRGQKTTADVIVVEVMDGANFGRGEAVPYARYGETCAGVMATLNQLRDDVPNRFSLLVKMNPGAARNALDCALWDLEAKQKNTNVYALSGLKQLADGVSEPHAEMQLLKTQRTAFTLSLDTPEAMAKAAKEAQQHRCLKLKLGGDGDGARMHAVRQARPDAELLGDANEAWCEDTTESLLYQAKENNFALIEQPLPAGEDHVLNKIVRHVPVCADESAHTSSDLPELVGRYDVVNIKLDKAGGLTEAINMLSVARELGFEIMVGCMVGTSLAMAPAFLLAQAARWVDLDGPLLLARDRPHGFQYDGGDMLVPPSELWGGC